MEDSANDLQSRRAIGPARIHASASPPSAKTRASRWSWQLPTSTEPGCVRSGRPMIGGGLPLLVAAASGQVVVKTLVSDGAYRKRPRLSSNLNPEFAGRTRSTAQSPVAAGRQYIVVVGIRVSMHLYIFSKCGNLAPKPNLICRRKLGRTHASLSLAAPPLFSTDFIVGAQCSRSCHRRSRSATCSGRSRCLQR